MLNKFMLASASFAVLLSSSTTSFASSQEDHFDQPYKSTMRFQGSENMTPFQLEDEHAEEETSTRLTKRSKTKANSEEFFLIGENDVLLEREDENLANQLFLLRDQAQETSDAQDPQQETFFPRPRLWKGIAPCRPTTASRFLLAMPTEEMTEARQVAAQLVDTTVTLVLDKPSENRHFNAN